MEQGKTIGELLEEARRKSGAKQYHGHDIMDLMRFDENTRHMVVFDVITNDGPFGQKGERTRLFLTEQGYKKAKENQEKGLIKILNHASVVRGDLHYDHKDRVL